MNRRQFMSSVTTFIGGFLNLQACTPTKNNMSSAEAEKNIWRSAKSNFDRSLELLKELVRYATLAPSSHNTQCWKFHIAPSGLDKATHKILIFPDYSRRCPVVDPDDHHLFVSLGCAVENLCIAAKAYGYFTSITYHQAIEGKKVETIQVDLKKLDVKPTEAIHSDLFEAIPKRQCTRSDYDGKPLPAADLELLAHSNVDKNVQLMLITDKSAIENVLNYVVQGNTAQLNSPKFVEELKKWIRFSDEESVEEGDGLSTRASGNPSIPRWLGSTFVDLFFTAKNESEKYAKQIRSASGIAIFCAETADKAHWVEVGRCYQRFALQATALGIRNSFLNQPLEVAIIRPQFATSLGLGNKRPDLVVRFGYAAPMPHALRRPVESVLI